MIPNANFNRLCSDLFHVDLGVDIGTLQQEITQCKLRYRREVWNVICNSVLKNSQGVAGKGVAGMGVAGKGDDGSGGGGGGSGGDSGGDTKDEPDAEGDSPKSEPEDDEEDNESHFYLKNKSNTRKARRGSRGRGGQWYQKHQPLPQQLQAAWKTRANQHHKQAGVTAADHRYGGFAANRRAPPHLRPPPYPAPVQQQQQQQQQYFSSPGELTKFLNRIQPPEGVSDRCNALDRRPTKIAQPMAAPVPVSSRYPAADVGQTRLPSSAVRRRYTLDCQLRPVEPISSISSTVDSDGAKTLEAANLQDGTATSASRDFVPLVAGDWFAARRPQRRL